MEGGRRAGVRKPPGVSEANIKTSREVREVRKVMKGGNGVSEANGITHSPTGEQNCGAR